MVSVASLRLAKALTERSGMGPSMQAGAGRLQRMRIFFDRVRPRRDRSIVFLALATATALPRRLRMPFLVWVSCKVDRWFFKQRTWPGDLDTHRERTLFWLLRRATDKGLRYDLAVNHVGREYLDRALCENRGVLVIGIHSALLYLAGRHLYDLPIHSEWVAYDIQTRIFGTRYLPKYLRTNATILIKIRRLLKGNAAVFVMIDQLHETKSTTPVKYAGQIIYLSRAGIDVALSAGAAIVFMNAFMSGKRPTLHWGAPNAVNASNAEDVLESFSAFLETSVANRW